MDAAAPTMREGRGTLRRWLIAFVGVAAVLLATGALLLAALNTGPGRGFVASQLARIAPRSGLTVSVGRIDGSLFGRLTIRDLKLGDPRGTFLTAPEVVLDWRPSRLSRRQVWVNELTVPELLWLRRPALRPTERDGPILPDIDVHVGRLRFDRIVLEPPVIGRREVARLEGRADLRSGRALVNATATAAGGDRVVVALDAEPDRDRFDLDARVAAPVGGVVATLIGVQQGLALDVAGDGRWSRWRGTARAAIGGQRLLDLAVRADDGRFTADGSAAPGLLIGGLVRRLSEGGVRLQAAATFADRRADATLAVASRAIRVQAAGVADLGEGVFDGVRARAQLLRPEALLRRATGRDVRLTLAADGPFARPTLDYAFAADRFALATTVLEQPRIVGRTTVGTPLVLPMTITATQVSGVGAFVQGLTTNVRVTGPFTVNGLVLTSNSLQVRSDKVNGRAVALLDLRTGRYDVALTGKLPRYLLPGVGLVDVDADLKVVPGADGRNPRLTGGFDARVARLDNAFFRWLLEGNPTVRAELDIVPGAPIRFGNARLTAPSGSATGSASVGAGGIWTIDLAGALRRFGPVAANLTGPLNAPVIALRLPRPGLGVGLANAEARLVPSPEGFAVTASGATYLGRATLSGRIVTRNPTLLDIVRLDVAGMTARGVLTSAAGAFAGRLAVSGAGVTGDLRFAPENGVQRIDAALRAENARLAVATPVAIERGTLGATIRVLPDATAVAARIQATRLSRGALDLDNANVAVDLRGERGTATGRIAGRSGVPFTAEGQVEFEPGRIALAGKGSIDERPVTLRSRAILTRDGEAWALAPVVLGLPQGSAQLAGRFGDGTQVTARLDGVGLDLLELIAPDLDLGGRATGTLDVSVPAGGGLPRGRANLRVERLTRTGLANVSLPVELALSAAIDGNAAAMRAVIQRRGVIIGRAQAQLRPIPGTAADRAIERLYAAPLFAQARFNGPAGALWPLLGISAFDVRGPVAIATDFGGRLGEPTVRGTLRANGARLESTLLGTVIEGIRVDSRFNGSRLEFASFAGTAGKGGTVTGAGSIDLSPERGFPIDLSLRLTNAQVIRRDDLRATVTGPLTIRSGRDRGLISGNLVVDRARFRIGRPATETVPELAVRERGRAAARAEAEPRRPTVWRLDIRADADNRVDVDGLGLESEWQAKLRIGGRADAPEVSGDAELIQGSYEFAGRRFELTRGLLRFSGAWPPDPAVDIVAENRVEGLTAIIRIGGSAFKPEIAFASTPALPEDEVLSRVLFGTSITNLSAPEALQLAGAVASLRQDPTAQNLDVLNILRRGIGVDRLRILPGDATRGRRAAVAAGEYIGNRVYVEVASDAQGYTATQLEVRLTRSLAILSQVATMGGTSVNLRWSKDY